MHYNSSTPIRIGIINHSHIWIKSSRIRFSHARTRMSWGSSRPTALASQYDAFRVTIPSVSLEKLLLCVVQNYNGVRLHYSMVIGAAFGLTVYGTCDEPTFFSLIRACLAIN